MFLIVLLLESADSVEMLDLKSEREEEVKSERLRMGVASENATLRGVARGGGCAAAGSGLGAVSEWSADFVVWLSSDDSPGVDGDESSVGTSGELCALRRNEPRRHHCTRPPLTGVSASASKETTVIFGELSCDGVGEIEREWKKCLTLSTIDRVRFGGRKSPFRPSAGCGIGSGIDVSIGLGKVEPAFEDDVDEHWVRGDGASWDPSGLCTTDVSPSR